MGDGRLSRQSFHVTPGRIARAAGLGGIMVLLVAMLGVLSCGDEETGPTTPTGPSAEELNATGWDTLSDGDYLAAVQYFTDALEKDATLDEARLGLGWSNALTGEYAEAVSSFTVLVDAGALTVDAYAGRAAAALAVDPALALSSAEGALGINSGYVFERRPSFDYLDLHLIMAEANFALAQYPAAQAQVDILDPDNALDPSDPNYLTDLAFAIEALRALVAGDLPV